MKADVSPAITRDHASAAWISVLFTLVAGVGGLLAHALAPALVVALWQDALRTRQSVAPIPTAELAWGLFFASYLISVTVIVLCAYFAGHAASLQTGRRGSGMSAAALVATGGALLLTLGGIAAILLQASPLTAFTMTAYTSPPLSVSPLAYHESLAQGLFLFYCAAYLPLLLLAGMSGLLGAARGVRVSLRMGAAAPTMLLERASTRAA